MDDKTILLIIICSLSAVGIICALLSLFFPHLCRRRLATADAQADFVPSNNLYNLYTIRPHPYDA